MQPSGPTVAPVCPCGSGKLFALCHGASSPPALVPTSGSVAAEPVKRKLDLACGENCAEGYEGVDEAALPGVVHVVDLFKFPWPFDDNSVAEIRCSHFIEHVPCDYVTVNGKRKDALFAFFDECYRILIPGGHMHVLCPAARNDRAFQDPTHRRFIVAQTFLYLSREARQGMKLSHYNAECDFGMNVNPTVCTHLADGSELHAMPPGVQSRWMTHSWNVVADWIAVLESKKPMPPAMLAAAVQSQSTR
jgi:hypothetical protein